MKNKSPLLSVSIVTYNSNLAEFEALLDSLIIATSFLPLDSKLVDVTVIDNSSRSLPIEKIIQKKQQLQGLYRIIKPTKNLGYGAAHNLAIKAAKSNYHLILNPDVKIEKTALNVGISYLDKNPLTVALSPEVRDGNNNLLFLTRQIPGIATLFLRGLNWPFLNSIFRKQLERYENRELYEQHDLFEVPLISGCFMLCRTNALKNVGGFDERYFLYFEDYALSLQLSKCGDIKYNGNMKIKHYGGNASRKGIKHIGYFIKSGIQFFNQFGWKLM